MARHSNGQDNYKVAGWVIAVAIAVVVAIIALLFSYSAGAAETRWTTLRIRQPPPSQ